ncbi:flagellar filament capping protein FliD [Aquabacterium sp. A7-Y]|uniref:flagellar filament capping protein FliD n=1 Tax=Aquabacterium sp. A7-Y TaxID=1349605 RepID=UPI00223CD08F|nr:flagellar filament capping protein FliD [Aquabacterium sp. A7-Y]MCW7536523.1 flagellar filament capping protein FliD [Aquabacterium sp. A7-Y]
MTQIDPVSMATQLATAYTQGTRTQLNTQTQRAEETSSALSKLQSALRAFESAAAAMSAKKGMLQFGASLSVNGIGSASATSTAQPGTQSLWVEQVATAHQISYANVPAVPVAQGGTLSLQVGSGTAFSVDLSSADSDADGTLSQAETARAINLAPNNQGQVSAMIVTVGAQTQLVLTSAQTGAGSTVTLDVTGLPAGALKDSLSAGPTTLAQARDAIVWLGAKDTGVKLQQASNTFTAIQGVSMTFTRASAVGDAPLTLSVSRDAAGTADNVRAFVDAFNTLKTTLDELTRPAKVDDGKAAAVFASDSGVRSLRNKLNDLIRQDWGGVRLMEFGVAMDRHGALSLDTAKLDKAVAARPDALNQLFGSTSLSARSGLLAALDTEVDRWADSSGGQIKRRQDSLATVQKNVRARQTRLDDQYEQAYNRYLKQFSQLQTLMSQMDQTSSMFSTTT